MNKKEIKAAVEEGQIHCKIMLQVAGTPKDHVEGTLKNYVSTIDSNKGFSIIESDYSPAEKTEDNFYSAFVDVDLLVKNTQLLTELCFNYMPSSIEFVAPKEITFKKKDIDNWFNDLLAKLHEISMLSKQVAAQNKSVVNNMNALIKNAILMGVRHHKSHLEIANSLGMREEDIEPFVKRLIQEGKIKAEKNPEKTSKKVANKK